MKEAILSGYKRNACAFISKFAGIKREFAWVAFGQILAFLGGILILKVLTGLMQPADYGSLALGLTIAGFINIFVYGPLSQSTLRYYSIFDEKGMLWQYHKIIIKLHRFALMLMLALIAVGSWLVAKLASIDWVILFVAAIIFGIAGGWSANFLNVFTAMRQRSVVAIHQGLDPFLRLIGAAVFMVLLGRVGFAALVGFAIGSGIIFLSQLVIYRKRLKKGKQQEAPIEELRHAEVADFVRYAASFSLLAIPAVVSAYADRWVIQGAMGVSEVGVYAAIYQIANAPIAFAVGIINQLLVPVIYKRAGTMKNIEQGREGKKALNILVGAFLFSSALVTCIAYLFSEEIVLALTSPKFAEHHEILWVLVFSISICWLGNLLTIEAEYHNQPSVSFWPRVAYTLLILVCTYYGVQLYGIMGVAGGMAMASIGYVAFVALANKLLIKRSW